MATGARRQSHQRAKRQQLGGSGGICLRESQQEAEQQRLERIKAEAIALRWAYRRQMQSGSGRRSITHFFSPDDARQMAAQFTSGIAPAAIQAYATELCTPTAPTAG